MTLRTEFWYVFGIAALLIILNRLFQTRRSAWQNPATIAFTLGVFSCTFGVLAKQPFLAQVIDNLAGSNAAWLVADILFLFGLTALTYWIDLTTASGSDRDTSLRLPLRRSLTLLAVCGWMISAAFIDHPTWEQLERGGIDVAGQPLLLTARLAYLVYGTWGLLYLSRRFQQLRQQMTDRLSYLRLTLAWAAVTLAALAPLLQLLAALLVFFQPILLPTIWPVVWLMVTVIQVMVAIMVLSLFFRTAYRLISWLDKQYLIRRLLRLLATINSLKPDLLPQSATPAPPGLFTTEPDRWLAILVNQLEIATRLLGASSHQFAPPAGRAMPGETRRNLLDQQEKFRQTLSRGTPLNISTASGDTYTLARWYAHFSGVALKQNGLQTR